ncbi:nucleotide-binding protein [Janibacter melonis]|uniref:nucleotide-binding protein n=1 Tax=Janibacter melonis TaxID=262209 RepID=UPI00204478B9|nr:nucleotide-binding protein [Janibacter melonis]MCM3556841.1 nucleotide-binding protein [Janibacter melonis]
MHEHDDPSRRDVGTPTPPMRVFIGSTSESLELVDDVAIALDRSNGGTDFKAVPWGELVFAPSEYPLQDLVDTGSACDFAILLATGDDLTTSRGTTTASPRDNVLLEIGLFIGLIGLKRTFIAVPSGVDLKLPSDLKGLTTVPYTTRDADTTATHARFIVGTVRRRMRTLGPRLASTVIEPSAGAVHSDEMAAVPNDATIEQVTEAGDHLQRNLECQGWAWSHKYNVLRVRSPKGKRHVQVISDDPDEALAQLSRFARVLHAHGARVHNTILRRPAD